MKLQFAHKDYQIAAVNAVVDCFAGQPKMEGLRYRIDPGKADYIMMDYGSEGFSNAELKLTQASVLDNVRRVQRGQNLPISGKLEVTASSNINLDVEMETGTGKTYIYIRTMFELNKRYGWSKFIVVVPSIAIREGVHKSLEITAEHFLRDYGKRARFFIYDSKHPHKIESFSSDGGINVMIINVQAFAARGKDGEIKGKDSRRIYEELDDFQSRKPIDVIRKNRPILILDEPQKMEGPATTKSLKEFDPLFVIRYSATHKTNHNKVHRLDALDAYQQKLVKKIRVHGIAQKGLSGTNRYLFVESIVVGPQGLRARVEIEERTKSGDVRRQVRLIKKGDNLEDLSGGLREYTGYVVSEIDAIRNVIGFTNGELLKAGSVVGDVSETALRRIQIRETIRAHFDTERALFSEGIKVLSLFFIDEVAKYRVYDKDDENPQAGEYARMFEEEYRNQLAEVLELEDSPWQRYLKDIDPAVTHNGYFSQDKKGRMTNPSVKARGEDAGLADDVDAYDLILKDKETLLSLHSERDDADSRKRKQVRFIFSHSALREGWDNPNVFTICTLKHSENNVKRRQEVGRGMRLCVNQYGERMDHPSTAHDINVLTVVANESYEDFVKGLQGDISDSLSDRPRKADKGYFAGKVLRHEQTGEELEVTDALARQIEKYLIKHDYSDERDLITETYHQAKKDEALAALPDDLRDYATSVFQLVDSVFSDAAIPKLEDGRAAKANVLNKNFEKKEFQDLWGKINRKAAYTVEFDSKELIKKAIVALNKELRVKKLEFRVKRGEQASNLDFDDMKRRDGFVVQEQETKYVEMTVGSTVTYDLIGEIAEAAELTRRTVAAILQGLEKPIFAQFHDNPEAFIGRASTLIKEQKATMIIEHLTYDPIEERYGSDIFTVTKTKEDFSKAVEVKKRHIYDYVFTDSKGERAFAQDLNTSAEVVVYAKLPRGFSIPTPVGDYNPDWAVAFEADKVKHVFFIAETKGSMSSLQLREIEKARIECARKFFAKITSEQIHYDVVDSYGKLMELVR
ncbi:MAG: DEAD/DEAH box helicase family protein [Luteolibacter sp.]